MKALVSGGAGFIGSHLVDALIARGDEVLVIDNLSTGDERNLADARRHGAELITADVTEFTSLERAVGGNGEVGGGFDCVFHLAAQVDVNVSVNDPGLDTRINVEGTVNMLELARRAGCDNFVFASSCAVYGERDPGEIPLAETATASPLSPYGQAKLACEGYVELYANLHGLGGGVLRFANVYGPRQASTGEGGVVAIFANRLATAEPLVVFGSGRQTRDFVYVGDVVAALIALADEGARGVFNVGTAIETSVLELVEVLQGVAGVGTDAPKMAAARPGEVERMALDPALAAEMLGWRPKTSLTDGLQATWAAHSS